MENASLCPRCHSPLAAGESAGLCATCLLQSKPAPTALHTRRRLPISWWWIGLGAALVVVVTAGFAWRVFDKPIAGGTLRWGGDATGGAPYIMEAAGQSQPIGFEAELAEYLAARMGVSPYFSQHTWEQLPQDLARGTSIDIILNGYEWWPEREKVMASTIPYYICKIQIAVRPGSPIRDWDDLHLSRSGGQLRVGVLSESAAHRYLRENFSEKEVKIIALSEEGITGVLTMVRQGRLDATVIDVPAAVWYIRQQHGYEDLQLVGTPAEPTSYVIFCRREDTALREQLNAALREALRDGSLKRILEKYGLWNDDQYELVSLSQHWPPQTKGPERSLAEHAWLLIRAAGVTVVLACLSMPMAIVLGILVALGRLYGPRWLGYPLALYVEILRGTPLLMQLFVIVYVVPFLFHEVGLRRDILNEFWSGVLALAINYSAYESENYRAGILAIPRGQMEAALALGMSKLTALRRIIVPQAVRIVIPPVTNDFISLFKDTSICSVIAVSELAFEYRTLSNNFPSRVVELGLMTAVLYLAMSWPLSILARRLERQFAEARG